LDTTIAAPITTKGADGDNQGTAGGEVLLRSTGVGRINLQAAITADGGKTKVGVNKGGNGGLVTIVNSDGNIMVHAISTTGGTSDEGQAGTSGSVQLACTGTVLQQGGQAIVADKLKVITDGNITLANRENEVDTFAAEASQGGTIQYTDKDKLTVGEIDDLGEGLANQPEVNGVRTTGGNGFITIKTINGILSIDKDIIAAGSGNIECKAGNIDVPDEGEGRDIRLNAIVQSQTGNITLEARGFVVQAEGGRAETNAPGTIKITSHQEIPPGLSVDLSGQFDWITQGPEELSGGQIMGMDEQGKPVSAAIQSVFVHPTDPRIVYVGTVGGGLWKTEDITRTAKAEPASSSKADAPVITGNLTPDTGGQLTKGKVYRYKITFVDATDNESNASEFKEIILTGEENKVTLENLPVGPTGTKSRRVYRTVGLDPANPGEPLYHYLGEVANNNPDVPFIDDQTADNDLGAVREIDVPMPIWKPLTDEYPSLAVGAMAFDPDDPNIFYIGTGSMSSSSKGGPSIGILKTVNGGSSFTLIGEGEFAGIKIRDIVASNFPVASVSAQYDAANRRLTVFFKPGTTTANQVVTAVTALGADSPLEALMFQGANNGSGTFVAENFQNVTSGGTEGRSKGMILPEGANNAIEFTAKTEGADLDGLKVEIISDKESGEEEVVYDSIENTLYIHLESGVTRATRVVELIEALDTCRFNAALATNNGQGTYDAGSFKGVTAEGTDTVKAAVVFNLTNHNNAVTFRAKTEGTNDNDIEVLFVDRVQQVVVGLNRVDNNGGLYISNDGGDYFKRPEATVFPRATVTDLIAVPDATATSGTAYFAAVVGGSGPYLDINTVTIKTDSAAPSLKLKIGSTTAADWEPLRDTRSFSLTVGGVTKTLTPNFLGVGDMPGVRNAINAVVNAATAFNGQINVTLNGDTLTFTYTGQQYKLVEAIGDPVTGQSLVGPTAAGIWKSEDNGVTWQQVTGSPVREMGRFRAAGRIMMTAYIPPDAAPVDEKPVIYAATLYGVRDVSQTAYGGQLEGIYRTDNLGVKWHYIMDAPASVELTTTTFNSNLKSTEKLGASEVNLAVASITVSGAINDFGNTGWRAPALVGKQFSVKIGTNPTGTATLDFSAVSNLADVAKAIADAINVGASLGTDAVTVTWDAAHNRFLIVSNTLLPVTISKKAGGTNIFATGLNPVRFAGISEIYVDEYSNTILLEPKAA
jgi:hypothetical protein